MSDEATTIAGRCKVHDYPMEQQDVGHGKWVPVCPLCEREHRQKIAAAFRDSFYTGKP